MEKGLQAQHDSPISLHPFFSINEWPVGSPSLYGFQSMTSSSSHPFISPHLITICFYFISFIFFSWREAFDLPLGLPKSFFLLHCQAKLVSKHVIFNLIISAGAPPQKVAFGTRLRLHKRGTTAAKKRTLMEPISKQLIRLFCNTLCAHNKGDPEWINASARGGRFSCSH